MKVSIKIEKIIFYILIFCLSLEVRHIFYSFGEFNEWRSIYLYGTDILILGLIIFWAMQILRSRKINFQFGKMELALGAFLAVSGLSLVVATNLKLGIYSYLKLWEFSLLFLYIKNNFSKFSIINFWRVFVAGAAVQGLIGIAQFLKQSSLGLKFLTESPLSPDLAGVAKITVDGEKIIRAYGLAPHPNILAAILLVAIFGLAWLWTARREGQTAKIIYIFLLLILLAGLFFTFSRAIMIVGFSALFIWLVLVAIKNKSQRKPAVIFFLLLATGYLLLTILYWPLIYNRFSSADIFYGQSLNLRSYYNQVAMEFIQKSPFWGIGQGNFVNYFSESAKWLQGWLIQPVHNVYLLIAAETGGLGLLAFLAFLFLTIKSAWSRRNDLFVSCLLFLISCFFIFSLSDHFLWDLQQGQILFWVFWGILASIGAHSSMDRSPASEAGN